MTERLSFAQAADELEREERRAVAILGAIAAAACYRQTRPLAAFAFGVVLSRVHGAALRRAQAELAEAFDLATENGLAAHEARDRRVEDLETCAAGYTGRDAPALERVRARALQHLDPDDLAGGYQ